MEDEENNSTQQIFFSERDVFSTPKILEFRSHLNEPRSLFIVLVLTFSTYWLYLHVLAIHVKFYHSPTVLNTKSCNFA